MFSNVSSVSDLLESQSSILFSGLQHQVMRCCSTSATTQAAALQMRDHSRSWIRYSPNVTEKMREMVMMKVRVVLCPF